MVGWLRTTPAFPTFLLFPPLPTDEVEDEVEEEVEEVVGEVDGGEGGGEGEGEGEGEVVEGVVERLGQGMLREEASSTHSGKRADHRIG